MLPFYFDLLLMGTIVLTMHVGLTVLAENNNINLRPRQIINAEKLGLKFRGNTTQPDHFKLLELDGTSLLVGARNAVYNLSMDKLQVQQTIDWPANPDNISKCKQYGKSTEECHNYIRVMIKQSADEVLICGTNAFRPVCRQYVLPEASAAYFKRELEGFAICPLDPKHNSTAVYVPSQDAVYASTVADLSGTDPLIYRKTLQDVGSQSALPALRTQKNEVRLFNDPDFVSSFERGDYVYFWFRETAVEIMDGDDKRVYSRVGRVCKNDKGGATYASRDTWTTFLKTRLNCSLAGDSPLYFDQLQATSGVVRSAHDNRELVYAVMTTPRSSVQMSAVCAFDLAEIDRVFDQEPFKVQQQGTDSIWLPYDTNELQLKQRPGMCTDDSKKTPNDVLVFMRSNSLMYAAVGNYFERPLLIDNSMRLQLTQVAVQTQVTGADGTLSDVVLLGTQDGRLLKLVNGASGRQARSTLVSSVQVFATPQPVRNLLIATHDRVVAVSDTAVRTVPLHFCANQSSCSACVHLQDPACAWNSDVNACVASTNGHWKGNFIQSVATGRSNKCPEGAYYEPELFAVNELYPQPAAAPSAPLVHSAESMAIAVVVTLALAASIGFVAGWRLSRWRATADSTSSAGSSDYDAASIGRARLTRHDGAALRHLDAYTPSAITSKEQKLTSDGGINLVLSIPDATMRSEKNLYTLNNGTLPKDYKVKRAYI